MQSADGLALPPFFLLDDRDNLVVPALGSERERARGLAVGIDALPGVGAMPHQQANHLGIAIDDGEMQRAEIVCGLFRQFGTRAQH